MRMFTMIMRMFVIMVVMMSVTVVMIMVIPMIKEFMVYIVESFFKSFGCYCFFDKLILW